MAGQGAVITSNRMLANMMRCVPNTEDEMWSRGKERTGSVGGKLGQVVFARSKQILIFVVFCTVFQQQTTIKSSEGPDSTKL